MIKRLFLLFLLALTECSDPHLSEQVEEAIAVDRIDRRVANLVLHAKVASQVFLDDSDDSCFDDRERAAITESAAELAEVEVYDLAAQLSQPMRAVGLLMMMERGRLGRRPLWPGLMFLVAAELLDSDQPGIWHHFANLAAERPSSDHRTLFSAGYLPPFNSGSNFEASWGTKSITDQVDGVRVLRWGLPIELAIDRLSRQYRLFRGAKPTDDQLDDLECEDGALMLKLDYLGRVYGRWAIAKLDG